MYALFVKEFRSFFSTLTGYVAVGVFLLVNSLFLWVFPGEFNVFEIGTASVEPFFTLAPWVFLLLVPAVTMKMLSDEKRSGTIELLLTKPIMEIDIILAKFFAGLTVVIASLFPTLVYVIAVYVLGNGTPDMAGIAGSYIGLFFLAAAYTAIGLFASSLSDNQIVAFLVGVFLSLFIYMGFDLISEITTFRSFSEGIRFLGINEHFNSMSRGVIDSRDLLYFISLITVFIVLSFTALRSRKW